MREIKFRAWDKRHNEMEYINDLYWFEENGVHDFGGNGNTGEFLFMQYTGLKDKNGKEIYEGDIINRESHVGFYVGFEKGSFVAIPLNEVQRLNWEHRPLSKMNHDLWAVEGNIYEDRHLLEGESNV